MSAPNIGELHIMRKAAQKAARNLRRDFAEVEKLAITEKGPADFVSAADRRSEEIIRDELSYGRPDFQFLGEESAQLLGIDAELKGDWWVVDPLDGTTNFLHRMPQFAISIAHVRDGKTVAALIYEPISDTEYCAAFRYGAWRNEFERLRVSGRTKLSSCLFATGIPFKGTLTPELHAQFLRELQRFMEETAGVRRVGAAALDMAGVASGSYEGYWERGISIWDIAAGVLLVEEAGGMVMKLDGREHGLFDRAILACAANIAPEMQRLLET